MGQSIVGHRGASYDAPENTISAFEEAWRQEADGVEGDFYFTADGHIVCIHDKDTQRTAGRKLMVAESTLEELRELEYGGWKDAKYKGESLATFADVAAVIPAGKLFVIELKTGPEIVPLLAEELKKTKLAEEQLLIIAFNSATVAKAKEMLPTVRAHWLTSYKQNRKDGAWMPTVEQVAETLKACGADGLGTNGNRQVVDEAFIATLKGAGMKEFHVWTIDDPADARYFQELGASGITTNRPALIRESLGVLEASGH